MAEKSGGYSVGNLEVSLTALGTSAADSLDLVIKRLKTIDSLIKSVGKKINSLTVKKGTLSSFDTLNKKLKSIAALSEKSGKTFASKFKISKTTLTQLEKVNKLQKDTNSSKSNKGLGFLGIYAGFRVITSTTKRLFGFASDMVEKASDYLETLNLWQVAFRDNTDMAEKFIQKMNRLYGVSEKNLLNYQAIFKNMFSSLGGLEEATSSKLSEAFTRWALDFSSLFNVSIESAMSKFQAVLSGQVRPVRSVSGFDITERTLFNIYQRMGGEKTMRQLDILEKRLLSVLAIYQQMDNSSALGDLGKTINQFANQSRITKEILSEIAQWAGMILKQFLDNNNVIIRLNAGLIVVRDVTEGIARYMGFSEPNFLDNMIEKTEDENGEIDKLQKKLLSFDRFEALNPTDTTGNLAIDQTILDAITDYESKMGNVDNLAQKLAEQWEAALGFQRDSEGNLIQSDETIEGILGKVKDITTGIFGWVTIIGFFTKPLKTVLLFFSGLYATNEEFRNSVNQIFSALGDGAAKIGTAFGNVLVTILPVLVPIVNAIGDLIGWLDEFGLLEGIIWAIGAAFAAWKLGGLITNIVGLITKIGKLIKENGGLIKSLGQLKKMSLATNFALSAFIGVLTFKIADTFLGQLEGNAQGIASAIMIAVGAVMTLVTAGIALFGTFNPLMLPIIVAGIALTAAGVKALVEKNSNIEATAFAQGGYPDRGTLFIAGEAGAEVVMSDSSGRTSVTNIVEMEEAVYRGARRALSEARFGGGNGDVYLDGKKVGIVTEGTTYSEGVRVGRMKQEK